MQAGTITIADDGTPTGTGVAGALYTAIVTRQTADIPLPDPAHPDPDWEDSAAAWRAAIAPIVLQTKRAWAREAQAHADALSLRKVTVVVAAYTATLADDLIALSTRAVAFAVTLPATASVGTEVEILDAVGLGGTYPVTIAAPAGETVVGNTSVNVAFIRRKAVKVLTTTWVVS